MRLSGGGVYHGWAQPGALRFGRAARGFNVTIGRWGRLAARFRRRDGFVGLTALAAPFGGGAGWGCGGAGGGWRGMLRQGLARAEACQQPENKRAPTKHQPGTGR